MARKYINKNKKKGLITGLLIGLVGMGCVGAVGALSQGFNDWDYKNWLTDKPNYVKLDFTTNKTTSELSESECYSILLDSIIGDKLIFDDDINASSVYQANGGLKFSTTSSNGYISISLLDYQFDHIRIKTKTYSSYNDALNTYACDYSSISVNGEDYISLSNNKSNTYKDAKVDVIQFDFDENQTQFEINATKRLIIYSIELWDDKANNIEEKPTTSTSTTKSSNN